MNKLLELFVTFAKVGVMTQAEKDAVDFANLNPKEGKNE